nr:MAG TPA: hypothetical protein [Caudoviricetes sp.]
MFFCCLLSFIINYTSLKRKRKVSLPSSYSLSSR